VVWIGLGLTLLVLLFGGRQERIAARLLGEPAPPDDA
jgi:hypothetical protein